MPKHLLRLYVITFAMGLAGLTCASYPQAASTSHGAEYWRQLKQHDFQVPAGEAILPLALEATRLLASTDPELRDGVGYELFVSWVYRQQRLSTDELNQLRAVLVRNARQGLGQPESDALFRRSFSLLTLSILAAEDLRKSFLDDVAFHELVGLAVTSLQEERDLRGYVEGKGWGHATAHCADLVKFLARNTRFTREDERQLVEAIAGRLQSAGHVFVWGEDARLALALNAIARRPGADSAPFIAWFRTLQDEHAALWSGAFDPARYVRVRTQLNALGELGADLEDADSAGALQDIRRALRELRAATG
ncbi:MAG: DUF2785 domain-containing protein [Gammaproteobacteria bacterium]|nr:DUF2785 domain-containing protein [Gammaproteobacteria bacterium]